MCELHANCGDVYMISMLCYDQIIVLISRLCAGYSHRDNERIAMINIGEHRKVEAVSALYGHAN